MKLKLLFLLFGLCSAYLKAKFDGARVDHYLQNIKNFSGAVLIAQQDEIVLKKGYGFACHEFEIPNTPETKFHIGSNTKSFMAVAIMQLQEKKLLNVQDTINKYIPGFVCGDKITIHHLLTHTSGIPNYYKKWTDICECKNLTQMAQAMKMWALEFEPGSQYCYSNTGYLLLAHILEKVTGISYENYIQDNIFKPLNMPNSGNITAELAIKNKAYGYLAQDNTLYRAPLLNSPLTLAGCGDIYSSLEDMHAWIKGLCAEKIISKESLTALLTAHVMMESSPFRAHGYGFFIDKKYDRRLIEYSGCVIGYIKGHAFY